MQLTKTAISKLSKLGMAFKYKGYTYLGNGCIAFRFKDHVEEFGDLKEDEKIGAIMSRFFESDEFGYRLHDSLVAKYDLKNEERFSFGNNLQAVNTEFLRIVFQAIKKPHFYLGKTYLMPIYITNDIMMPEIEAVVMPIRYNRR